MTKHKFVSCFVWLLSFISIFYFSITVQAEEILKKGASQYLGWVRPDDSAKFRTCAGNEISIASGSVKQTSRKCSKIQRLQENIWRRTKGLQLIKITKNSKIEKIEKQAVSILIESADVSLRQDITAEGVFFVDNFISNIPLSLEKDKSGFSATYKSSDSSFILKLETSELIHRKSSFNFYINCCLIGYWS